jgi:hypothetical protein
MQGTKLFLKENLRKRITRCLVVQYFYSSTAVAIILALIFFFGFNLASEKTLLWLKISFD